MATSIGPLHVRRSVFVQASPDRVWREFQSYERIAGWLDRGHSLLQFEPRPGGLVEFSVTIDGAVRRFGGLVLTVDSARELTVELNWHGEHADPVPTFWTFRLTPIYDGTLVELFHHGFERFGDAAGAHLEGYEWGWDVKHLAALREIVERA